MSTNVKLLNNFKEIEAFINAHDKCVIKFSADWCAPCRRIAEYFENASNIYGECVQFARVDMTEDDQECSNHFQIEYYPTFKAFYKGDEQGHVFGANFQHLCDLIKNLQATNAE